MDGMSGWKGAVRKIDLDAFFQLAEEVTPFHSLFPGFGLVGPQRLPGIPLAPVPPFIRRRAISINQGSGFTRYDADGNLKGLLCMRVDLPKIVPPFIL